MCRTGHGRAELSVPCFTNTDKFCKPVPVPAAWRSGSSVRSVQLARLSLFSKSACLGEFSPLSSAGRGLAPELRPPRAAAPLPSACGRPERAAAAALGGLSRFGAFPPSDTRMRRWAPRPRSSDAALQSYDSLGGNTAQLRPPPPQPQGQSASAGPAQGNAPQPAQTAPPPAATRPAAPPVARPATAAVAGAAEARRPGGAGGRAAQRPANVKIGRNEMVTVMNPTTGEKQAMKFKKAEPLIRDEGWRLVPSG